MRVTEALGPVEICAGSHLEGYRSVFEEKTSGKSGAYSLRLNDEDRLVGQFEKVAPLSQPGDLILLDYYTLHRSGRNKASHPRWSVQFRYFDFDDSFGRQINWRGSFAEGVDFQKALEKGRYLND